MKSISGARLLLAGLAAMLLAAACDNSERNVITERAPFFQTQVTLDATRTDAVIETVRAFATQHRMDFLLARKSLPPGDFNASADGPLLNLSAMHIAGLDEGVDISAIARGDPTPEDRALVEEFVAQIRRSSGAAK